ncbi:MAG TPA: hypothetical protein VFS18_03365, partial [Actinomycetota bacterium]|nr:hypothetical protein [Actinomycetota bacterium]
TWRPQVVGFDGALAPVARAPVGTVASESYARGAHYLPIPSFEGFRNAFMGWWDEDPVGWERRAYEAGRLIGWAYRNARPGDDLAATLEELKGERFGGLDVTFGPDDHTVVEPTTLGLWVVPRRAIYVRERTELPDDMPWVPLFRTFSTSGRRTDVREEDWRYLFRSPPPPKGPAPRPTRTKFGVTTSRNDPVH